MVVKITSGTSVGGILAYNLSKVDKQEASVLYSTESDFYGNDMNSLQYAMEALIAKNGRVKNPVFACSINPHPDESNVLSDDDYREIAKDYMAQMGYENQPFVIIKHEDTDRTHVHIVSVRIDETGKKISSDFEHYKSNSVRKKLEEKYKLLNENERTTLAQKRNNQSMNDKDVIKRYEEERATKKGEAKRVAYVIRYVKDHYLAKEMNSFNRVLAQFGIKAEVNGREVTYTNRVGDKFTPRDLFFDKSEQMQHTLSALEARFKFAEKRSEYASKDIIHDLRKEIDNVLSPQNTARSISDVKDELAKRKICMNIFQAETGSISGLSFIDNVSGHIFKGSDLGKEYSAGNIIKRLENKLEVKASSDEKQSVKPEISKGEVISTIKSKVEEVLSKTACKDLGELKTELMKAGVKMIEVDDPIRKFKGCRFALMNEDGKIFRHIVPGSALGKAYTKNALERTIKKNHTKSLKEDKSINSILRKVYNEIRKDKYYFESDLIKNLSSHRVDITKRLDLPEAIANAYIDKFINEKRSILPEIVDKEVRYNRVNTQLMVRLAEKIAPEKRVEFLSRNGIDVEKKGDNLYFVSTKNRSYAHTWQEVALPMIDYPQAVKLNPFVPMLLPQQGAVLTGDEVKPFTKMQKDIFKAVVTGTTDKLNLSDMSNSLVVFNQYLSKSDLSKIEKKTNEDQSKSLCEAYSMRSLSDFVTNLTYRGMVIVPALKDGNRTYLVGNIHTDKKNFVELPVKIVDRLRSSNYDIMYQTKLNSAIWSQSGYPSQKLRVISKLAIAMDKDDRKSVERILVGVGKINKSLEISLRKDIGVGGEVNYRSMINKVSSYKGTGIEPTSTSNVNITPMQGVTKRKDVKEEVNDLKQLLLKISGNDSAVSVKNIVTKGTKAK